MKILISGASGFVGTALTEHLHARGVQVVSLVRRSSTQAEREVRWDPAAGELDPSAVSGCDVVVNLNGRSIAGGRWSDRVKAELRSSRLDSTRTLVAAIARADRPPPLLISASATGYYGDRDDETVDESSAPGDGFLADLARDWEEAALEARSERTRVVLARFGMILGDGGALDKMLTPFKLGLGGPIGSGDQWWPWAAMADVAGVVDHVIAHPEIDGPVNVVAPGSATSRQFAKALGDALGRPAVLPAPAFAVKLAMGEMAEALLLASTKVEPRVLEATGYTFRAPTLGAAFRQILN
jgi:uncharacterized protein (TIGR01777 family)